MLPDDFENLSASIVASGAFANNILSCITTKNYWDIVNTYKPLMHMWYAGLLMQAHVILPLILAPIVRFSKTKNRRLQIAVLVLFLCAFTLYLLPVASTAQKFYYLPFRLFEFLAGALAAVVPKSLLNHKKKLWCCIFAVSSLGIIILHLSRTTVISQSFMLVIVVLCTVIDLIALQHISLGESLSIKLVASIGQASFSIYVWHQIIVAFMYYCIVPTLNIVSFIEFALITTVVSVLSYRFIERPFSKIKKIKSQLVLILICVLTFLVLSGGAFVCYKNSGVVRDVPELGIREDNIVGGMHSQYNDRVYSWDVEFVDDERTRVLVFGDSFGRDFANILSESTYADRMQISYIYISDVSVGVSMEKYQNRIQCAERIFFAPSANFDSIPQWLSAIADEEKIYIVGTKNFGNTNGIIYSKRNKPNYYEQTVRIDQSFISREASQKHQYGNRYISLLDAVMNDKGEVRVFTDDGKFISQDCRHLTQFGAQFYASVLDFSWLMSK